MKKSIIIIAFLFFTGFAFSQTTVTLQDQCNCEVLSGTAVTTPGVATPAGADTGDIYVNTNTGAIYFWDGDSWELTATDDQQLTGFSFDGITNELTLTLENGGSVNVDLSSLSDTLADTNTTITSFDIDGTNTNLVITDSDTNTFSVALADLAALVNSDSQDLTLTGNTLAISGDPNTDVDLSGYLDNTDAQDLTLTGNTLAISGDPNTDVDLSGYLDNTDNQNAGAVPFTATGNTTSTDVQAAIEEIQTELDAVDGTDDQDLTLTGNTLAISGDPNTDVDLSGYLDNTDAQDLTLTGNTLAISGDPNTDVDLSGYLDNTDNQNAGAVPFTATGNTTSTDVQAAIEEIQTELDAVDGTDDQDLTLTGNTLAISGDPNTDVDLSGYLDNTDDQTAGQVDLDTPIDLDGDTVDDYTTVEGVLQDVAPVIPAIKAARVFYPPSIAIDASTTGTQVIDLYAQYIAQYGTPMVRSDDGGPDEAPAAIPTYADDELYYYITYADPAVFDTTSTSGPTEMMITADGELRITVIAPPADYNSLINVVFVVK